MFSPFVWRVQFQQVEQLSMDSGEGGGELRKPPDFTGAAQRLPAVKQSAPSANANTVHPGNPCRKGLPGVSEGREGEFKFTCILK